MAEETTFRSWIRQAYQGFLEFLYPSGCAGCGIIGKGYLCENCIKKVHYIDEPRCTQCSIPLESEGVSFCIRCRNLRAAHNGGLSIAIYEEPISKLIKNLKFDREIEIASFLSKLILQRADRDPKIGGLFDCDLVHPVPLAKKRLANRGFNQSALIAKTLAQKFDVSYRDDILVRSRNTDSMIGLGYDKRLSNVSYAFTVMKPQDIESRSVLLVDDVMTSGATIDECARTLKLSGAKRVKFLTVTRQLIGDDWNKIEEF